jgi:hypothetical protein
MKHLLLSYCYSAFLVTMLALIGFSTYAVIRRHAKFTSLLFIQVAVLILCLSTLAIRNSKNREHVIESVQWWNEYVQAHPNVSQAITNVTHQPVIRAVPGYWQSFKWPWIPNSYFYLPCPLTGQMLSNHSIPPASVGLMVGPGHYVWTSPSVAQQVLEINHRIARANGWQP